MKARKTFKSGRVLPHRVQGNGQGNQNQWRSFLYLLTFLPSTTCRLSPNQGTWLLVRERLVPWRVVICQLEGWMANNHQATKLIERFLRHNHSQPNTTPARFNSHNFDTRLNNITAYVLGGEQRALKLRAITWKFHTRQASEQKANFLGSGNNQFSPAFRARAFCTITPLLLVAVDVELIAV